MGQDPNEQRGIPDPLARAEEGNDGSMVPGDGNHQYEFEDRHLYLLIVLWDLLYIIVFLDQVYD